jgi:hypothetical protein
VDCDSTSVHHGLAEVMVTRFTGDRCVSNSGDWDLAVGVQEVKEGRLVHHRGCRYVEG